MVVKEFDIPVVFNKYQEPLVEISRSGLTRYVRMRNIPGGVGGLEAFYKDAMTKPFHIIADDLLTSELKGGLSGIDHPDSFDIESGASHHDKAAGHRSLRFDYFQLERIDPTKPRRGRIAIHYSPTTEDDDHQSDPELAIEFDIDYPSVALLLSNRHPESWLSQFYDELEEAGDSFFAAMVFSKFARGDDWKIGLPRKMGTGMSQSFGSEFLNAFVRDPVMLEVRDRFGSHASYSLLDWAHGIQEGTVKVQDVLPLFEMGPMSDRLKSLLLTDAFGL